MQPKYRYKKAHRQEEKEKTVYLTTNSEESYKKVQPLPLSFPAVKAKK